VKEFGILGLLISFCFLLCSCEKTTEVEPLPTSAPTSFEFEVESTPNATDFEEYESFNYEIPSKVLQLVLVTADGSDADIMFYEKNFDGSWIENKNLTTKGFVGTEGVGEMREGFAATPAGLFPITEAFYIDKSLETGLDSFKITEETYWIDDPESKFYNQRVEGTENKDWNSAEHMSSSPQSYECGFVIGYNIEQTPGAGSAVFFHVIGRVKSEGCVVVAKEDCYEYLRMLDKNKNPYVLIMAK